MFDVCDRLRANVAVANLELAYRLGGFTPGRDYYAGMRAYRPKTKLERAKEYLSQRQHAHPEWSVPKQQILPF